MLISLRRLLAGIFIFEAVCPFFEFPNLLAAVWRALAANDETQIYGALYLLTFFAVVSALFGVGGWTTLRGTRWARGWAIAASVLNILVALPFLLIHPMGSVVVAFPMGLAGLTGIVVFCLPAQIAAPAAQSAAIGPVPGDGTSAVLNKLVWLIALLVGEAGFRWWMYWNRAHSLPRRSEWEPLLYLIPILAITIVVHELGHAWAGLVLDMKISSAVFGPFDWRITGGKWKFTLSWSRVRFVGGAVGIASTRANEPRWHRVFVASAGPLANLLFGAIAFALAVTAAGSLYERYWGLLADVATISTAMCLLNLIPLRVGGCYSDGAKIYQMLSGGIWADYLRVNEIVSSVRLTSLRPRDYDLLSIERVVQNPPTPLHVLYCYLYSIECHLDRGEILEAREALEKADAASQTLESGITLEICTELVFLHAYLKRDAIATRSWWNRMEALTPNPTTWDYVLASVALQWIDGDLDEAEELWQKGNSAAEALPTAGGYDFDRYCFSLLRRALDESSAVSFKSREPEEDGANGFALQPG